MRFVVNHRDHAGNLLYIFDSLVDLKWRYQEGKDGPSTISYGIALSDGGASLRDSYDQDAFAPKRTDFELVLIDDNGGEYPLLAGPIWSMSFTMSEDIVWVQGLDWLAGLYNPYSGFSYKRPISAVVADLESLEFATTYLALDNDLLAEVVAELFREDNPSEVIALKPWRASGLADPAEGDGFVWSRPTTYTLWRSDGMSKLDHLTALASMGSPYGFDFWADVDKIVHMVGPRVVNPGAVTPVASFAQGGAIIDGTWTNNGPLATETIMLAGSSNVATYHRSAYQGSIDTYRRWTEFATAEASPGPDGADSDSQAQVNARGESLGYLHRFPQRELTLTVNPYAAIPGDESAFFFNHVMKAIQVTWDHPSGFHKMRGVKHWITGMEFEPDESGGYVCNLTLDQIN